MAVVISPGQGIGRSSTELTAETSAAADDPFNATIDPVGAISGTHHARSRGSAATARLVTTSYWAWWPSGSLSSGPTAPVSRPSHRP